MSARTFTLPPVAIGETWAEHGGIYAGTTTAADGQPVAVVLLPDRPTELLNWKQAMAWAGKAGAVLPTRPVAAMLFANLKAPGIFAMEPSWHWTYEELDGSYAWSQDFGYGGQDDGRKSYEGRAVAVRLIQLTAQSFNSSEDTR